MFLDALIPILQTAGIATEGVDLFLHYMPASITEGVILLPSLAGAAINTQLPGFRNRDAFQAIVRSADFSAAMARAERLQAALWIPRQRLLPAVTGRNPKLLLNYIHPKHDPIPYPRQPSGGWEVSMNFFCSWVNQDLVPHAV